MLQFLFVALIQTVAGSPETPAEVSAPAAQEQPATDNQIAETAEQAAERRRERRCRSRAFTGSRLSSVVTCGRGQGVQDQDTREALHDMQRPAGTSAN